MRNQKISHILFDLGEVIFTNDWHYDCPDKFAEYEKYYGINYDQMEKGWKAGWPAYETGKISEDEFWRIFLTAAGARIVDIAKAKMLWRKYFGEKPGMLGLLEKLKHKANLAVFSSTGKEWLEYKKENYNLDGHFKTYLTTFEMGIKKSDPLFFAKALNILAVKPEQCLLVDDTEKIISLGKASGMRTVLFKNAEQLENEFYKLNILKK